jgi:hypothetical protein
MSDRQSKEWDSWEDEDCNDGESKCDYDKIANKLRVAESEPEEEAKDYTLRCGCGGTVWVDPESKERKYFREAKGDPLEYHTEARFCWPCILVARQASVGFEKEFRGARLYADFSQEIAKTAHELLERRSAVRGLFVAGPPGVGKTRLMAALVAAFSDTTTYGLARALMRTTWDPDTAGREIRKLSEAPLLILDDLGREGRATDHVNGVLHEVISARNGNFLPTAVTSNLSLDQLARRYEAAVIDRIRPWRIVTMYGASRR